MMLLETTTNKRSIGTYTNFPIVLVSTFTENLKTAHKKYLYNHT